MDPMGMKIAFKNKWITQKDKNEIEIKKEVVFYETVDKLNNLQSLSENDFNALKKRKLCEVHKINLYRIKKGKDFNSESQHQLTELTGDFIAAYKDEAIFDTFKKFNFNTTGHLPICGSLHPLLKIRSEFKKI